MSAVTYITAIVLFCLIGVSQERILLKTRSRSSQEDQFLPSTGEEDVKPPKQLAVLEGLQVQDAQMYPDFDPTVVNYTVILGADVADVHIIAKVSLGQEDGKYKIKTKSNMMDGDCEDCALRLAGNQSSILVQVHVSGHKQQAVTYYLEIRHVLQGSSTFRSAVMDMLYVVGTLLATVVVAVFAYSIYLAVSSGGVAGEFSRISGHEEEHQLIIAPGPSETVGSLS